jgi:hypothetical protein
VNSGPGISLAALAAGKKTAPAFAGPEMAERQRNNFRDP